MKSEMTLGLVVLTLAFAGCSEGTTGTGSNAGSSQQHVVNRPTDNGSMPSTTSDASGTNANSDRTGSSGTTAAPGSGMHNGSSNAGSDVNGAAPSTYAPGQSGATTPSGADAGTNAGSKSAHGDHDAANRSVDAIIFQLKRAWQSEMLCHAFILRRGLARRLN